MLISDLNAGGKPGVMVQVCHTRKVLCIFPPLYKFICEFGREAITLWNRRDSLLRRLDILKAPSFNEIVASRPNRAVRRS